MFCYEYACDPCNITFEEIRQMADRNKPACCPICKQPNCKKIMSRTQFNAIFIGSTKREALAEHYTQESIKAQAEGFRSKDEIETAIGLANERAKQMDQPDKQLIGPVESPYKGEKYKPSQEEVKTADTLVRNAVKAQIDGNDKKIVTTQSAMREHEQVIKSNAKKQNIEFKPKNTTADLAKQIKASQGMRGKRA